MPLISFSEPNYAAFIPWVHVQPFRDWMCSLSGLETQIPFAATTGRRKEAAHFQNWYGFKFSEKSKGHVQGDWKERLLPLTLLSFLLFSFTSVSSPSYCLERPRTVLVKSRGFLNQRQGIQNASSSIIVWFLSSHSSPASKRHRLSSQNRDNSPNPRLVRKESQGLAVNTLGTVYSVHCLPPRSFPHVQQLAVPEADQACWATWNFSVIFHSELGNKVHLSLVKEAPGWEIRVDGLVSR